MRTNPLKSLIVANSAFLRAGVPSDASRVQGVPLCNNTKNVRNNNINTLGGSREGFVAGVSEPAAKPTRMSPERAIQRALLARMASCLPLGAVVLHVPNEDATGSAAYGQAKIRDGVMPGCPDLLIVFQGRAYWLEMKAPEGVVSDAQRSAHKRLRMAGTPVEVAYSVEDGLAALEAWGLVPAQPRPDTRSQSSGRQSGGGV